jgi:hypothetical protein
VKKLRQIKALTISSMADSAGAKISDVVLLLFAPTLRFAPECGDDHAAAERQLWWAKRKYFQSAGLPPSILVSFSPAGQ